MDVSRIAETDAEDLLRGRQFAEATGSHGVVESDFFSWPIEVVSKRRRYEALIGPPKTRLT